MENSIDASIIGNPERTRKRSLMLLTIPVNEDQYDH